MNQRAIEGVSYLQALCLSDRSKALLKLAEDRKYQDRVIFAADGSEHPVPAYAMQLFFYAYNIGCPDEAETESYLALALLMAMEQCKTDLWSYGAKLMFDVTRNKINITRKEWEAFHAQDGDFTSNPDKRDFLANNMLALAFYCSDLITRVVSLPGVKPIPATQMPEDLANKYGQCWVGDAINSIEQLANTFIPAAVGMEAYNRSVLPMISSLKRKGGFFAPATLTHEGEAAVNLAQHTCSVIWRYCDLCNPQTDAEVGMAVLAGICANVRKISDYQPTYATRKAYVGNGKISEPDGRKFNWEQYIRFEEDNQIAMANNKNLFMVCRYLLADLPEMIATAIDACNNRWTNIHFEHQVYMEPMGLYLHLADFIATHHDDLRKGV